METSQQDALDLLRKWQAENRVIHCTISANGVIAKILGRIDTVENDTIHLSAAKSNVPLGEANFTEFPLTDSAFEYLDAAHTPEPLRNKLKGYDALLTVHRLGVSLALAVLPPLDEWAKL